MARKTRVLDKLTVEPRVPIPTVAESRNGLVAAAKTTRVLEEGWALTRRKEFNASALKEKMRELNEDGGLHPAHLGELHAILDSMAAR